MSAPAGTDPSVSEAASGEDRGALEIHRSVLRTIAEHAADTVSGSARVRRRIAGVGLGTHGASARLTGPDRELRVGLDVALHYPGPIPETVRAMRERVAGELDRLAGCQVRSVTVTVSALVPASEPSRVE